MIILENDELLIEIAELGAEIQRIFLKETQMDYLWDGNPEYWAGHAPVLFPIVGRLNENTYLHKGKRYHLPQHGFARRMTWDVLEASAETAIFSLKADVHTKENYPFEFTLYGTYTLNKNKITLAYTVRNDSEEVMPYSIGSHPAFRVPIGEKGTFENHQLTLMSEQEVERVEYLGIGPAPFLNGAKYSWELKAGKIPMERAAFQQSLLLETDSNFDQAVLLNSEGNHGVQLDISNYPYFCLWTKEDTEAPFLCMEPFNGLPDLYGAPGELLKKAGILLLNPHEQREHTYTMELF